MVRNIESDDILLLGIVFYMRNIILLGFNHQKKQTCVASYVVKRAHLHLGTRLCCSEL